MKIDSHFHVFLTNAINKAESRYPVGYDALIDQWQALATKEGIDSGVLVQPSFLGFDNTLLLGTLQQSPNTLRGIAVLEATTSRTQLLELQEQGIVGARLNLFGDPSPSAAIRDHWRLIELLNECEMHLELHHDDGLLNHLLLEVPTDTVIVADHFGRPKTDVEFIHENLGIQKHANKLWVKLSAQYRTPQLDHAKVFDFWRQNIGDTKLLWGSDWPHTRFETSQTYAQQLSDLNNLVGDEKMLHLILTTNPKNLYGL
jgi:predicted TIM-barrel fold metal-dependent hydrolase